MVRGKRKRDDLHVAKDDTTATRNDYPFKQSEDLIERLHILGAYPDGVEQPIVRVHLRNTLDAQY